MAIILINTCVIGYGFIDEKFPETVQQVLKIKPQWLIEANQIQKLDGKAVKVITHTIYFTLTVGKQTKNLAFLLMTKLRNYHIILG